MTARRLAEGVTFVLGGARSGKSAFAEGLAEDCGRAPVYIATGRAFDSEMTARIADHQARRGRQWRTVEAPLDLAGALRAERRPDAVLLVDCLTLWLTNLMMEERGIDKETAGLLAAFRETSGPLILVSNEVGLGIVPENRMARDFRDHAGRLHQAIAAIADTVVFVAAGLPLTLKG